MRIGRKGTWNAMNELTPDDLEINRHIDKLDQVAIKFESKWGPDVLPRLVPDDMAAKWKAQTDKLNDAIQRRDLPMVADLVAGTIRGYSALDAAATAAGHTPAPATMLEGRHPDTGNIYRIAVNDMDARKVSEPGVVVYTLTEVIRLLESMQLVNVVKKNFPHAQVTKTNIDWQKGDDLPF